MGQPGWTEARRFAGRPFAQATSALGADSMEGLAQALLRNPETASNALNNVIGALTHIRSAIEKGDEADLQKRLDLAFSDRETWLNDRFRADWSGPAEHDSPKAGDMLKHIFLGGRPKNKK